MKIFRCQKCFYQFYGTEAQIKSHMVCGAYVGFVIKIVGGDAQNVPVGCGGEINEVTPEEALNYVEQ